MLNLVFETTNIYPITGVLFSPKQIGLEGSENIDLLPPDYDLLNPKLYALNNTFYGYTSRGCVNKYTYCGVHNIEVGIYYIDIKDALLQLCSIYGDKTRLKLMDNNTSANLHFEKIIQDLVSLGYGKPVLGDSKERTAMKLSPSVLSSNSHDSNKSYFLFCQNQIVEKTTTGFNLQ